MVFFYVYNNSGFESEREFFVVVKSVTKWQKMTEVVSYINLGLNFSRKKSLRCNVEF